MPNTKVLQSAEQRRQARSGQAMRVYKGYADQVPELIQQLGGTSKFEHNRAYNLLFQMNFLIVPELTAALRNGSLPEHAKDDLVSLLGTTGDEQAREAAWQRFQMVRDNPTSGAKAARSLANLGDARVLSYVREQLDSDLAEQVTDLVVALVYLGELEDIPRLRAVHRRFLKNDKYALEIRRGAASAILAILGEMGNQTANRVMDQINNSFADTALWRDIDVVRESTIARVY